MLIHKASSVRFQDSGSPHSDSATYQDVPSQDVSEQIRLQLRASLLTVRIAAGSTSWLQERVAVLNTLSGVLAPVQLAQTAWLVEDLIHNKAPQARAWSQRRCGFQNCLRTADSYDQVASLVADMARYCDHEGGQDCIKNEQLWRAAAAHSSGVLFWLPQPGQRIAFFWRAYTEHLVRSRPPASAAPAPIPDHWQPMEQCTVLEISFEHVPWEAQREHRSGGDANGLCIAWLLLQRFTSTGDTDDSTCAEDEIDWQSFSLQQGFQYQPGQIRGSPATASELPASSASSQDTDMHIGKSAADAMNDMVSMFGSVAPQHSGTSFCRKARDLVVVGMFVDAAAAEPSVTFALPFPPVQASLKHAWPQGQRVRMPLPVGAAQPSHWCTGTLTAPGPVPHPLPEHLPAGRPGADPWKALAVRWDAGAPADMPQRLSPWEVLRVEQSAPSSQASGQAPFPDSLPSHPEPHSFAHSQVPHGTSTVLPGKPAHDGLQSSAPAPAPSLLQAEQVACSGPFAEHVAASQGVAQRAEALMRQLHCSADAACAASQHPSSHQLLTPPAGPDLRDKPWHMAEALPACQWSQHTKQAVPSGNLGAPAADILSEQQQLHVAGRSTSATMAQRGDHALKPAGLAVQSDSSGSAAPSAKIASLVKSAVSAHSLLPSAVHSLRTMDSNSMQQPAWHNALVGTNSSDASASARKRSRTTKEEGKVVPALGYRERWLAKRPRPVNKSWLSALCSACEKPSGTSGVVTCAGPCLRAFHPECASLGACQPDSWFCAECDSGRVQCFACKEFSAGIDDPTVRKCSLGVCGRFYHIRCAQALPHTQMGKTGVHFRCPQHYCSACGKSGDGVDMAKCLRCACALHTCCIAKHQGVQRLVGPCKIILCSKHIGEPPPGYRQPPALTPADIRSALAAAQAAGLPISRPKKPRAGSAAVASAPPTQSDTVQPTSRVLSGGGLTDKASKSESLTEPAAARAEPASSALPAEPHAVPVQQQASSALPAEPHAVPVQQHPGREESAKLQGQPARLHGMASSDDSLGTPTEQPGQTQQQIASLPGHAAALPKDSGVLRPPELGKRRSASGTDNKHAARPGHHAGGLHDAAGVPTLLLSSHQAPVLAAGTPSADAAAGGAVNGGLAEAVPGISTANGHSHAPGAAPDLAGEMASAASVSASRAVAVAFLAMDRQVTCSHPSGVQPG